MESNNIDGLRPDESLKTNGANTTKVDLLELRRRTFIEGVLRERINQAPNKDEIIEFEKQVEVFRNLPDEIKQKYYNIAIHQFGLFMKNVLTDEQEEKGGRNF